MMSYVVVICGALVVKTGPSLSLSPTRLLSNMSYGVQSLFHNRSVEANGDPQGYGGYGAPHGGGYGGPPGYRGAPVSSCLTVDYSRIAKTL